MEGGALCPERSRSRRAVPPGIAENYQIHSTLLRVLKTFTVNMNFGMGKCLLKFPFKLLKN